ncbi:hypothetical protein BaRGS_00000498, partial [Batillaria attramentaria]
MDLSVFKVGLLAFLSFILISAGGIVIVLIVEKDQGDVTDVTTDTPTSPTTPSGLDDVTEGADDESSVTLNVVHDCFPDAISPFVTFSADTCHQRGCIYDPSQPRGQPWCYFPNTGGGVHYSAAHQQTSHNSLRVELGRQGAANYGGDFVRPVFKADSLGDNVLRFTVSDWIFDDEGAQRYRVPVELDFPKDGARNPQYEVRITGTSRFSFQIVRRSTGTYLQLATRLPSKNVYGFGENLHDSFRHPMDSPYPRMYPAFSRDLPPTEGMPMYGVQPFYMCVEDSEGNSHGVLLLNSNAQEYTLASDPRLTYRTIGGILDFYVFLGPSPEAVIQQYTAMIGRPVMPPYWGLGFQMCKYGYNTLANMQRAVSETQQYGIPLDVQYADIDYMDARKDFTVDHTNFGGLNNYWHSLRDGGMHTDPCFAKQNNYEPYEKFKQIRGNIQWPQNVSPDSAFIDSDRSLLGNVWPDPKVVFPDFFKNVSREAWKELIIKFRSQLIFDGLWIDMNEPSNFETNLGRPSDWPAVAGSPLQCGGNKWDDPPYRPLAAYIFDTGNRAAKLSDKTVCMNSVQGNTGEYRHYDVHSLYAWSQTRITNEAVRAATGERGMVITRSNFPGSGMLEYNLFGIPYVGADICGFNGETTHELCLRWMQLGAFYPFSRNHNAIGQTDQHPGKFGDEFGHASREVMEARYWMLPYLYTLFHEAHTRGGTVVRPLHHEFPKDSQTLGIDRQFLWGPAFLISPILEKGQSVLHFYVPEGRWYDFYTGAFLTGPGMRTVPITYYSKPLLHLRGGHIVPMQRPANNTAFSRRNPFTLKVMLSDLDINGGSANGSLFWDDGKSMDTYENGNYYFATFTAQKGEVRMLVQQNHGVPEIGNLHFETVTIHGVVDVDSVVVTSGGSSLTFTYDFQESTQLLNITGLSLPLGTNFVVQWSGDNSGGNQLVAFPDPATPVLQDCFPEAASPQGGFTQEACERRHCAYDTSVPQGQPWCFLPMSGGLRYSLESRETTSTGFKVTISRQGLSPFGKDFTRPTLYVDMLSNDVLRFRFDDDGASPPRYKVPVELNLPQGPADDPKYVFHFTNENTMAFQVIRKSTGVAVFDTGVGGLVLSDQFLQLSTKLASRNVYGLGENLHETFRHQFGKSWPAFARDQPPYPGLNLYGVQPFYTCVEDDQGNTHGVLIFNSNAQEYVLNDLPMFTYRTIGGILDFFVFLGPSPEAVIQQYTELVGRPVMPPYWALGFQMCRYGYNSLANMQTAVSATLNDNIPFDVQYADIDHMDERKDFTVDNANFNGLNNYFRSLKDAGMHVIIILDPALIVNETNYEPYEKIKQVNGYINWPSDVTPPSGSASSEGAMLGYVWPKGKVAFPDFFKDATRQAWKELVVEHHARLVTDGLWIDMNEPANFGTNEVRPFNWPEDARPYWSLKCGGNEWDEPPYRPRDNDRKVKLSDKTLCMVGVQGESGEYRHYDVHNLYGWSETPISLDAARAATGERSIVISRSTFPGSGKYAGHWLGDNYSAWAELRRSIIGMLEFNLFGIPYVGADICGFMGDTTFELCLRWMQLGAFYPFSRNHNAIGQKDQHPSVFGSEFAAASREILEVRYWLLPYLYTLFHEVHTQGGTVVRPLHHEFPTDVNTLGMNGQFLWGPALLISPILNEGAVQLNYYLPAGRWYDFYTGAMKSGPSQEFTSVTRFSKPALHVRGGYVLPTQRPANNTHFSRQNPFTLRVYLDDSDTASGSLFWDDGKSRQLQVTVEHLQGVPEVTSLEIEAMEIHGVTSASQVTVTDNHNVQTGFQTDYDASVR